MKTAPQHLSLCHSLLPPCSRSYVLAPGEKGSHQRRVPLALPPRVHFECRLPAHLQHPQRGLTSCSRAKPAALFSQLWGLKEKHAHPTPIWNPARKERGRQPALPQGWQYRARQKKKKTVPTLRPTNRSRTGKGRKRHRGATGLGLCSLQRLRRRQKSIQRCSALGQWAELLFLSEK